MSLRGGEKLSGLLGGLFLPRARVFSDGAASGALRRLQGGWGRARCVGDGRGAAWDLPMSMLGALNQKTISRAWIRAGGSSAPRARHHRCMIEWGSEVRLFVLPKQCGYFFALPHFCTELREGHQ